MKNTPYWLGIDIGSTTVKLALVNSETKELVYHKYQRHGAKQRNSVSILLKELNILYPCIEIIPVFCGSGAKDISEDLQSSFIQEVVANAVAIRNFYPQTRVSIELGGQDAKVTFFHFDEDTKQLMASDMRMNGSCAGGTGAFLDEVAGILKLKTEELESFACRGDQIFDISGRCGVFAKSDIQPLLNQGIARKDLALSTFHAIAKQTIGGLAQGLEIRPPVIFEGGPLHFNPRLVEVFAERLKLKPEDILIPDNPETIIAYGAALSVPAMFPDAASVSLDAWSELDLNSFPPVKDLYTQEIKPFFENKEQEESFLERHCLAERPEAPVLSDSPLNVFLGIDAGSTTSKFILMDENEKIVDMYYSRNNGEPLKVVQQALLNLKKRYNAKGIELNIMGVGTTGYGELLFAKAFGADYHTVETVSHAEAALKYAPGTSFILDIGGQDMKAIFIRNGIVSDITLNEACSAGCGSFLENFASTLKIPVQNISEMAFASKEPSRLGSRCTVFMNSSIITEQKNGKTPEDIMAGLCNSIIENVFTKVIRLSNMKSLGDRIIVQGGTFKNNAVLRAMELFTEKEVIRAPYPGEMGAIGIALLTIQQYKKTPWEKSDFMGWKAMEEFNYKKESGLICQFCSNNCNRTAITFSNGNKFITGNRCERGEVLGEIKDNSIKDKLQKINSRKDQVTDLFLLREKLLFTTTECPELSPRKSIKIGIPRVLEFWQSYPFWNTIFTSLGFETVLSSKSSMKLYENGLKSIPSDTVCFPAKLSHGHIQNLINKKVDRIFMPIMNRMIPENKSTDSHHACAVLKGYAMVLDVSDEPEEKYGIPMDSPVFHWVDEQARENSILAYFRETFGLPEKTVSTAIKEGLKAQKNFQNSLEEAGRNLLDSLKGTDKFAVVIAGRPYHSDPLIHHNLSDYFARMDVPVLPQDALPGIHEMDLTPIRAELTINYHVRMFAAARYVAEHPALEYVQIVSFGCGHDAVISDDISRILREGSGKNPLMLKMDESDASGPINIRTKSFIETVRAKRLKQGAPEKGHFKKPYEIVFTKNEKKTKTIMVPNVSRAFAIMATAAIKNDGYKVEPLPLAGARASALGKKYVHNDMCYPAQINIGEFLAVLDDGSHNPDEVVLALAKDQCDCRLAHYAMMARQALNDAGYPQIPIVTTDKDTKKMHPGFSLSPLFELRMLWGLTMMDVLEDLRRKIRPYELTKGETNFLFDSRMQIIADAFDKGIPTALKEFEYSVDLFTKIKTDRNRRKPRVFVIGEFLLNFHPGSNNHIEQYLEDNGMEVVMPHLFYNIHREYLLEMDQNKEYFVKSPVMKLFLTKTTEKFIRHVLKRVDKVSQRHPFHEERPPLREIAEIAQPIIDKTFTSGEGWMIAGEILHHAEKDIDSFLILQPFGCLPNHVTGRGLVKGLKKANPHIQILALDYDPDTSFANVENRLQMLIINAREKDRLKT